MAYDNMDYFAEKALQNLGDSKNDLTENNIKKIKSLFPIPREYKIVWAQVRFGTYASGIVFTDRALIVKADKTTVKEENKSSNDKKKSLYHLIKWEYFDVSDFNIKKDEKGKSCLELSGEKVLNLPDESAEQFKNSYIDAIERFAKVSETVSASIFSAEEAVFTQHHARVHNNKGHGEMAEEALTMLDKIKNFFRGKSTKNASVVGRNNEANGPDRLVNGMFIQTKYCASGQRCVNACFDKTTGLFRYYNDDGSAMVIEVPKDKYVEALATFREKIKAGKVPGETDPDNAGKYIKKGKLTYQQAVNLTKPGTIESLAYDTATGIVTCTFALGLTFLVTFIMTFLQIKDKKTAFDGALAAGIQVFGITFVSHMLTSQLARTGLSKTLIPFSTAVVKKLGPRAARNIVNAIRALVGKKAISGAAAMKSLAKILRNNAITATVTFVVFSIPDTTRIIRRRITRAQYTKNMLSLVGGMAGAAGGTLAAAAITGAVVGLKTGTATGTVVAPGVGTAIGAGGGLVGGVVVGTATKIIADAIHEDDALIMSRLFDGVIINLMYEYMLQQEEIDMLLEKLGHVKQDAFKKLFMDTIAAENQEIAMADFVEPFFVDVVKQRPLVSAPSANDIAEMLKQFDVPDSNQCTIKLIFMKLINRIKIILKKLFI
jgi:hypothetical protein